MENQFIPFDRPKLASAAVKRLEKLHRRWWTEAHGEKPAVYARAKMACFGLAMEALPALISGWRASRAKLRKK
jgi:hypothetical protein